MALAFSPQSTSPGDPMRPVTITDLNAAARVLMALPEPQRPAAMTALIARAAIADQHRRLTGRQHPAYGNGTLLAAALAHSRAGETTDETGYLTCLACAIEAVMDRRLDEKD
jgi:hypothetical protein